MKQQERNKTKALGGSYTASPPSLSELKALRLAQRATNQRVEELKMRVFRLAEQHMEQAVSLLRRWMDDKSK